MILLVVVGSVILIVSVVAWVVIETVVVVVGVVAIVAIHFLIFGVSFIDRVVCGESDRMALVIFLLGCGRWQWARIG